MKIREILLEKIEETDPQQYLLKIGEQEMTLTLEEFEDLAHQADIESLDLSMDDSFEMDLD